MTYSQVEAIRRRIEHNISPYVAAHAGDGCTVENIKQFVAGAFMFSDAQLVRLANYFSISKV